MRISDWSSDVCSSVLGPISTSRSPGFGSTAWMLRSTTPRSCRKCWPRDFFGGARKPSPAYRLMRGCSWAGCSQPLRPERHAAVAHAQRDVAVRVVETRPQAFGHWLPDRLVREIYQRRETYV